MFGFDVVTGPTNPARPARLETPPAKPAAPPRRTAPADARPPVKPAIADPAAPRG